ncbi:MAG TPA: TIGR03435 family protein [Acidobacteriaceae bacterium]|jgi:uncharacterized protein (TIGR03435 family)|nr:TIGR03435 family protein [Acidobacteriaceae bacterium]
MLHAQLTLAKAGETVPSFEVATIKPNTSESGNMRIMITPTGFSVENVQLRQIIKNAWGARTDGQLIGGPDALLDQHFDIDAKVDPDDVARMKSMAPKDRGRITSLMLQALLADRFHLKIHIETRDLPVYALVVAKGGPKLTAAAPAPPESPDGEKAPPPGPGEKPGPGFRGTRMSMSPTTAEVEAHGMKMEGLASMLSGQSETESRVVMDKTGLTGEYDFTLHWAPERLSAAAAGSSDPGPDYPPLLTALQEQLGLKLDPQRAPVESVVIEHVEPPTPN